MQRVVVVVEHLLNRVELVLSNDRSLNFIRICDLLPLTQHLVVRGLTTALHVVDESHQERVKCIPISIFNFINKFAFQNYRNALKSRMGHLSANLNLFSFPFHADPISQRRN